MKRIPIPDAEAMEHRQRTAVLPPRPSSARCGRRCWAHAGEALDSRRAFEAASAYDQDSVIEFLKTLQVPAPGTPELSRRARNADMKASTRQP